MISLPQLAMTFLKIGALGFGGPFSLLAIMQKEIVERNKWLTADEFTQSIGIGTMTPGPIFFAAAIFIGYRLRGIPGAVFGGLNVRLPSFILVVVIATLYVQVEQNTWVVAITRGIAAGVVGLFLSVVLKTGRATAKDARGVAWVFIAFAAVAFFKVDPLLLIVIAGPGGAWLLRPMLKTQTAEK
jgi:chromate transporter